jgi:hypothetical protein
MQQKVEMLPNYMKMVRLNKEHTPGALFAMEFHPHLICHEGENYSLLKVPTIGQVSDLPMDAQTVAWVGLLTRWCIAHGFEWVFFEPDGDVVPELPRFEKTWSPAGY